MRIPNSNETQQGPETEIVLWSKLNKIETQKTNEHADMNYLDDKMFIKTHMYVTLIIAWVVPNDSNSQQLKGKVSWCFLWSLLGGTTQILALLPAAKFLLKTDEKNVRKIQCQLLRFMIWTELSLSSNFSEEKTRWLKTSWVLINLARSLWFKHSCCFKLSFCLLIWKSSAMLVLMKDEICLKPRWPSRWRHDFCWGNPLELWVVKIPWQTQKHVIVHEEIEWNWCIPSLKLKAKAPEKCMIGIRSFPFGMA